MASNGTLRSTSFRLERYIKPADDSQDQSAESFQVFVRIRPASHALEGSLDSRKRRIILHASQQQVVSAQLAQVYVQDPYQADSAGVSGYFHRRFNEARNSSLMASLALTPPTQRSTAGLQVSIISQLRKLLPKLLAGYNTCCFAFGMTGSGKTHTMLGDVYEAGEEGLVTLAVQDIFGSLQESKNAFSCKLSYLEIYNENVQDLLRERADSTEENRSPSNRLKKVEISPQFSLTRTRSTSHFKNAKPSLKIQEDPERGVFVKDLSAFEVSSVEQLKQLITRGNLNRTMAPTGANQFSSRSHALLQLYLQNIHSQNSKQSVFAKLSLIDLAGSERGSSAQNRSQRLFEGSNINKSLLALCNCITLLSDQQRRNGHVPYRNSKLTHLLKDSLGGSTRTSMIACVSPLALHYEESISTLKYAERAGRIQADRVSRNVKSLMPESDQVAHFQGLIANLQLEVMNLKQQLNEKESKPVPYLKLHSCEKTNSNASLLSKTEASPEVQMKELKDKNSQLIERISRSLVKNIEEYVETNHTLNDLRYEIQLLEMVRAGAEEDELVGSEIATKELLLNEMKESLDINLKQRAKLEQMLVTLNQQNSSVLQHNAKLFQIENVQLKLKNKRLQEHIEHLAGAQDSLATPFSAGRITYEGGLSSETKLASRLVTLNQQTRRNHDLNKALAKSESFDGSDNDEVDVLFRLENECQFFMHEESSVEKNDNKVEQKPSLPRVNLDLTKFSKIQTTDQNHRSNSQKESEEDRIGSQETMNTHQEEIDLNIQSMITPLPHRERIIPPTQPSYRSPSLKRERTKNSFTLTMPLESGRREAQGSLKISEPCAGLLDSPPAPFEVKCEAAEESKEDKKNSTFVFSKLEALLNDDADINVNLDNRTHSSADSVIIGSRKPSSTLVLTEECSSVNFLSPETRRGVTSVRKDDSGGGEKYLNSEGPNLDDVTLQQHSGRLPPKSSHKNVFPFAQREEKSEEGRGAHTRLNLAKINPKIAESGRRDLLQINSGERTRGHTLDSNDMTTAPPLSGRQALTTRNTNHFQPLPKLAQQYQSATKRGKMPPPMRAKRATGANTGGYSDLHKKQSSTSMAKYRTIDVPKKEHHPRGPCKNVSTKKLAPKQLQPKRANHSYSLQKTSEKKSEKKLGSAWKFGRGGKNGSSPSPSGGQNGSQFFSSFCSAKKGNWGYSRNQSAQNRYQNYKEESEVYSRDLRSNSNTPSNVRASPSLFSIPNTARQTPVVSSGRFICKKNEQLKEALFSLSRENKSRAVTPKNITTMQSKPTFSPLIGSNPLKTVSNATQELTNSSLLFPAFSPVNPPNTKRSTNTKGLHSLLDDQLKRKQQMKESLGSESNVTASTLRGTSQRFKNSKCLSQGMQHTLFQGSFVETQPAKEKTRDSENSWDQNILDTLGNQGQ